MKFFISFGSGHVGANGQPLFGRYLALEADSEEEARNHMFRLRGAKWCMIYGENEYEKAIKRWNLEPITEDEIRLLHGNIES